MLHNVSFGSLVYILLPDDQDYTYSPLHYIGLLEMNVPYSLLSTVQ